MLPGRGDRLFGYLRPVKAELKGREYELYRSVYCGLCRHLGKDYGVLSRLTLSYDCTVLAMLSLSLRQESSCVTKGRCVVNPMKKCLYCDGSADSFRMAGAVSVIMTYYKLYDTIADSGFFKRTAARFIKLFMKRSYKKAARAFPQISERVSEMLVRQQSAESSDSGIDPSAEPTALLISWLCTELAGDDEKERVVLGKFGYFLGRWIYLMDAADDLEKDIRKKQFNPFKKNMKENMDSTMLYCNDVLNMTAAQILLAYDLIGIDSFKEILDNIVRLGLSFQQRYCLFEKRCEKNHRKVKKDYYPFLSEGFRQE